MITKHFFDFKKDVANKRITVVREFAAPVAQVWKAWTEPAIMDQWWAPKPWKTETAEMDFREGGHWLYSMVGPDDSRHYCRADYKKIVPQKSYEGLDAFCDKDGKVDESHPRMSWHVSFDDKGDSTIVHINITFPSEGDMEKIIEMGFQEGFTSALGNLDELLEK